MKKQKQNSAVVESTTTETEVVIDNASNVNQVNHDSNVVAALEITLPKGRPVDPNSARQKKLAEMAERAKANGGKLGRGRPINPESDRQKMLATKKTGNGKQGRPTNPDSERQKKLAIRNAKLEALKAELAAKATPEATTGK